MKTVCPDSEYKKFPQLIPYRDEVQKIVTWSGKEAHLPNLEEWEVIRFFHACLYSVEVTKQCIDLHYTTRTHCPDIFQNFDPWCERIQLAMDVMAIAPLTKLTPEGNKVIISRLNDLDSHKFHYVDIVRLYFMVFEFLLGTEGILKGYTMVFDLTNSSLGHVARIGPVTLKKFLFIIQDAPHFRTTGIHFVNILPLVDKLIALLKPFLRQPLMNNLHSHTSLESFYKFAPKDILPVEYGGCEPALETISEEFYKEIKENREYFLNEEKTRRVNEQLRPGKPKNASDLFGAEGNFKQLVID